MRPKWLQKYHEDRPAVIFDFCSVPEDGLEEAICLEQCAFLKQTITAAGFRYCLVFYPRSPASSFSYDAFFSKVQCITSKVICVNGLDEASFAIAFNDCLKDGFHLDYYREMGKKYRMKMHQQQILSVRELSWHATVRYSYKAAIMDEFVHDYSSAIK